MKIWSRVLFIVSLLTLIVYSFDLAMKYNKTLLYIFMLGFSGTFVTSFFTEKTALNTVIRWISFFVVAGILLYIFVFGFLWGLAVKP